MTEQEEFEFRRRRDAERAGSRPTQAAEQQDSPSMLRIAAESPAKAVNTMLDQILNTPTRIANLGIAGVGSLIAASGHPDLAPNTLPDPDWIRHYVGEGTKPAGDVQEAVDKVGQFATLGAMSPGSAVKNAMMAGTSGLVGHVVGKATDSPTAELIANIATPFGVKGAQIPLGAAANKAGNLAATVGAARGNQRGIERLARNRAVEAAGDSAPKIIAAAKNATEYVPGSKPTIGEAVAQQNMGQPSQFGGGVVKLQSDLTGAKGIEDILPSVTKAQDQAMIGPMKRMAGTPQELQAAIDARTKASKANYGVSDKATLPGKIQGTKVVTEQYGADTSGNIPGRTGTKPVVTPGNGEPQYITGIDGMPKLNPRYVPDRTTDAAVSIPGVDETIPGRTGFRTVATNTPHYIDPLFASLMERPAMKAAFARANRIAQEEGGTLFDDKGNLTGKGAHLIKLGLDDEIGTTVSRGIGESERNKIVGTQKAFIKFIEDRVPAYETARAQHAEMSAPINKMQAGQALLDKLVNSKGTMTPSNFLTATGRKEAETLQSATGWDGNSTLESVLGDADAAHVRGVGQDLSRRAEMDRIAASVKGGRGAPVTSHEVPQLPNLLSRETAVLNYLLRGAIGDANLPVARELANRAADPARFAELLGVKPKPTMPMMMKDAANQSRAVLPIAAMLGLE